MSTGLDREFVADYCHRMTDDELLIAVTQHAVGLTPEAIEVIETELKRRKLHGQASSAVAAQNKQHSAEEIDAYCAIVQKLPCPRCGQTILALNGGQMAEAVSVVLFSTLTVDMLVACPRCLDELNTKAQAKTALLGWWGLPGGPIKTVRVFNINWQSKKVHHAVSPNRYLKDFVLSRIGEIEMHKNNTEKLSLIISR